MRDSPASAIKLFKTASVEKMNSMRSLIKRSDSDGSQLNKALFDTKSNENLTNLVLKSPQQMSDSTKNLLKYKAGEYTIPPKIILNAKNSSGSLKDKKTPSPRLRVGRKLTKIEEETRKMMH